MNDRPTGEELYNELCNAAGKRGLSLATFAAPLFNSASWKIEQMCIARHPTSATIARVRALIAGEPLPPARKGCYVRDERAFGLSRSEAEERGIPPSSRSIYESYLLKQRLKAKSEVELLHHLSELAHETRSPGQTLQSRLNELRREFAA